MPKTFQACRCIKLHTYSVHVTLGSWDVVTHVCRCGRVHFEETIPAPQKRTPRPAKSRRSPEMR